jgi:hypothetical protein
MSTPREQFIDKALMIVGTLVMFGLFIGAWLQ